MDSSREFLVPTLPPKQVIRKVPYVLEARTRNHFKTYYTNDPKKLDWNDPELKDVNSLAVYTYYKFRTENRARPGDYATRNALKMAKRTPREGESEY